MSLVFDTLRKAADEKKKRAGSAALHSGDYYLFREESIKAKAPPVSGVYALYTRRRYLLVGESENIQEALLQLQKQPRFRFTLAGPIGFTFEVCSAELRAERARELIAEYHPILERKKQAVNQTDADRIQRDRPTGPEPPDQKAAHKRFRVSADQLVVLVLVAAIAAVLIVFLGVLADKKTELASITKLPANFPLKWTRSEPEARTQEDASSSAGTITNAGKTRPNASMSEAAAAKTSEAAPAKAWYEESPITRPQASSATDETISLLTAIPEQAHEGQIARQGRTWTVQVAAFPNRRSADVWVSRLQTKGYDAFSVAADVDRKTWYRVRVGSFGTRERAETLRNVLVSHGFRDAFVTG